MHLRTRTILLASAAIGTLLIGAGQGFAAEVGDFQATLAGATMGIPLGAAPPPGLYFGLQTFVGPNAVGTGQNSAAAGANGGKGATVFGEAITPSLVWSTGWNFLGGTPVFAVIQPFYTVGGLATETNGPLQGPPVAFGSGSFFENVHNTIWSSKVSWNLNNGWHASAGFNFQGPDGTTNNGTLNQDYWTFSPTFALAYLTKDWKITINSEYDIHTASAGHTGFYSALAEVFPTPFAAFEGAGNGYTGGNQLFVDWAASYKVGKWSFGPAGDFKFQTTADTPGSGFTCAQLNALNLGIGCGNATDISLGGMIGYNLGVAELEFYIVDSVYNKDDFDGIKAFVDLSFKLWPDEAPPSSRPMLTK
jgi:hypothetical protein